MPRKILYNRHSRQLMMPQISRLASMTFRTEEISLGVTAARRDAYGDQGTEALFQCATLDRFRVFSQYLESQAKLKAVLLHRLPWAFNQVLRSSVKNVSGLGKWPFSTTCTASPENPGLLVVMAALCSNIRNERIAPQLTSHSNLQVKKVANFRIRLTGLCDNN